MRDDNEEARDDRLKASWLIYGAMFSMAVGVVTLGDMAAMGTFRGILFWFVCCFASMLCTHAAVRKIYSWCHKSCTTPPSS